MESKEQLERLTPKEFLWKRLQQVNGVFSKEDKSWLQEKMMAAVAGSDFDATWKRSGDPDSEKESLTEESFENEKFYYFQYGVRAAEKSGLLGFSTRPVSPRIPRWPATFSSDIWKNTEKIGQILFPNLKMELEKFSQENGETVGSILRKGENVVCLSSHPSWNSLALPMVLAEKANEGQAASEKNALVLAPGPMMFTKEMNGMTFDPRAILQGMGVDIITTTPPDKKNEAHPAVLKLGNISRRGFILEIKKEREEMKQVGGKFLIIAPEGTTTKLGPDGKYQLQKIKEGTAGLLKKLAELGNVHFLLAGISEENPNRLDTDSTNISIETHLVSVVELKKRLKDEETFSDNLMRELAKLVDGTYGDPSEHLKDIVNQRAIKTISHSHWPENSDES
ncbi:hypothetical protein HOA64_05190 [bacterium]|nr:hypothetical protein [bacterium]MBT6832410.1 hypothetical protein [bacterium]MBT7772530.1 hypothetical protein [bacterium]